MLVAFMQMCVITAPAQLTRSLLALARFSWWRPSVLAGDILQQHRPFLQLPENTIECQAGRQERNPTANGDMSPQTKQAIRRCWVRDVGTAWALDGQQAGKGTIPLLVTDWKQLDIKCLLTNSISQAWKRDLGNCRQIILVRNKTTALLWTVI